MLNGLAATRYLSSLARAMGVIYGITFGASRSIFHKNKRKNTNNTNKDDTGYGGGIPLLPPATLQFRHKKTGASPHSGDLPRNTKRGAYSTPLSVWLLFR
jgi:hypothetical protein